MGEGVRDADPNTPRDNSMAVLIRVERGGHVASPFLVFEFLGFMGFLGFISKPNKLKKLDQPNELKKGDL
jgi:hypothetical protein